MTNPFEQNPAATDNSGVTVSIKAHAGYDSPMIVVKGGDAGSVVAILGDTEAIKEVIDATHSADTYLHEKFGTKASGGTTPGSGRPASATKHPSGKTMECEHGERQFKTGVVKSGKNAGNSWRAFDCPKGVCDRVWDRD